ncbi:MAG TPA: hypothetical protein VK564_06515, partial [Thermodesulfobacteriota bacterium]|nr:hypothetical protein [Thermodesulfobacteriota bacterium]
MNRLADALKPLIDQFGFEGIEDIGRLLGRLKQEDPEAARYLLQRMPLLIERLFPLGQAVLAEVFRTGHALLPHGSRLAVAFLEMGPEIYDQGGQEALAESARVTAMMARVHEATGLKILEKAPVLLKMIGVPGLEKVAGFSAALARSSWTYTLKNLESSPVLIEQLLQSGDQVLVLAVYDLATRLALNDWNYAIKVLEESPEVSRRFKEQTEAGKTADLFSMAGMLFPLEARTIYGFLHFAPALVQKAGLVGLEAIWRCLRAMAPGQGERVGLFLKKSASIIEDLQTHLGPEHIRDYFEISSDLARVGSRLAFRFLMSGSDLCARLSLDHLKNYAEYLKGMARISLQTAEAFLEVTPALLDRIGYEDLKKTGEWIKPLAREYWESAARILLKTPELIDRLGWDGLKGISDFTFILARESGTTAVQLLDRCPQILDRLLPIGPPALVNQICSLGSRIAPYNARLALSFMENSPEIIRSIGFEGLEKLERLAREVGRESGTTAVALVEASPALIERVGFDGLEQVAELSRLIARENSYGAIRLLENSADWIDGLKPFGEKNLALQIYRLAESQLPVTWRLAPALVEKSPEILKRLGLGGLKSWADLMQHTAKGHAQSAVRLLELSPAVLDRLGFEGLEKIAELLRLLSRKNPGEALALVDKVIGWVEPLADLDRKFPQIVLDLVVKVA